MDERHVRVGRGWVHLRRPNGERDWHISWEPPHEDFPAVTYSPGDTGVPDDFPETEDADELLAWARERWGERLGTK
jgi:hypothetical protein